MIFRLIVVGLIRNNKNEYLICKMPEDRGVFPGQWGVPGGGVRKGERIKEALRREISEELGLDLTDATPMFFRDDIQPKLFPSGIRKEIYMIYLFFDCKAAGNNVKLSDEFSDYIWVKPEELKKYKLNSATSKTFRKMGLL